MKKSILILGAFGTMLFANNANAQETVVVAEEQVAIEAVPCQTQYYSTARDNWFIQVGAGIAVPLVENPKGGVFKDRSITANYNVGFGKWISPYLGWRVSFQGGSLHWNQAKNMSHSKYVTGNVDFMWDMFNSYRVNPKRVFSIIPFVGLGGTYVWDYKNAPANMYQSNGKAKHNEVLLPVSAGLQLRFRLSKYVDFFAEGRAQFYGDNFNNYVGNKPVDINITAVGGFSFNIGGSDFNSYNPCDYIGYINSLNNQVNDLRAALATTSAALAAAEAQLPCPEVVEAVQVIEKPATPLMATVRFKLNSAKIQDYEMVNVYNIAQWMKANPEQKVVINGYADKDTGTSKYNMALSQRRAEAVKKALVDKYGISADRLAIDAQGSNVQPYDVNNWNRIVIFSAE